MALQTMSIRKGSTRPIVQGNLEDSSGTVIDLADVTAVTFTMYNDTETIVDASSGSVLDSDNGYVSYTWSTGDTDTAGTYYGYFTLTFSDSTVMRAPSKNLFIIEIVDTE